jgi:hypothetical protein
MKYIFLLLISFNVLADIEIGAQHLRINQNLFNEISFPMDALQIDATYWYKSFGIRALGARSTETANNLYVENKFYTNKINAMYGGLLLFRFPVDKFKFEFGAGKTDYKSTWRVNGVEPAWSKGTDSDWSYYAGVTYPINKFVGMRFSYSDIYRKNKPERGREETRAFGFGFVVKF